MGVKFGLKLYPHFCFFGSKLGLFEILEVELAEGGENIFVEFSSRSIEWRGRGS